MKKAIKRAVGKVKTVFKKLLGPNLTAKVKGLKGRVRPRYKRFRTTCYRNWTLKFLFPLSYRWHARKRLDENKVVFVEVRFSKITNSFSVLYDTLVGQYTYNVQTHFLTLGFAEKKEYHRRVFAMIRDIATAKYIFLNEASNVMSAVPIRKGTTVLQAFHGCGAFKKFGFSTADLIFGETVEMMLKYPTNKNYTYVTVSSPEVIWAYAEAMHLEKEIDKIRPTGVSRTDVFYDKQFSTDAYKKLHQIFPQARGKKVILFAPTFRGRILSAKTADQFSIGMFRQQFLGEYVLLMKHHPLVKNVPPVPAMYQDFALDVTKTMEIDELLCVSDICISDYSSLIFEFSLFERPLVFFAYDYETFFDWRGFYYPYEELTPGPICRTNQEMIDYIAHIDERFDKQKVIDFREKFMRSCDGHATERILDLVFGDTLAAHRREKPLAHIRPLHTFPTANTPLDALRQKQAALKKEVSGYRARYEAFAKEPLQRGKVVFYNHTKSSVSSNVYLLYQALLAEEGFSPVNIFDHQPLDTRLAELATAEYIVLYLRNPLVNALKLRKGTQIIFMWERPFFFKRITYSSFDMYVHPTVVPLHAKYDIVPTPSKVTNALYAESFYQNEKSLYPIGVSKTDQYFEPERQQITLDLVYGRFPQAYEKKIILYLPTTQKSSVKNAYVFADLNALKAAVSDEYVLLVHFTGKTHAPIKTDVQDFAMDVSNFPIRDLIGIADVMVGDYRPEVFEAAIRGIPLLALLEKELTPPDVSDCFYQYDELVDGAVVCRTTEALAKRLKTLETYDYATVERLKRVYFGACDGGATGRLVALMRERRAKQERC